MSLPAKLLHDPIKVSGEGGDSLAPVAPVGELLVGADHDRPAFRAINPSINVSVWKSSHERATVREVSGLYFSKLLSSLSGCCLFSTCFVLRFGKTRFKLVSLRAELADFLLQCGNDLLALSVDALRKVQLSLDVREAAQRDDKAPNAVTDSKRSAYHGDIEANGFKVQAVINASNQQDGAISK